MRPVRLSIVLFSLLVRVATAQETADRAGPFSAKGISLRSPSGFLPSLRAVDSVTWKAPIHDGRGDVTVTFSQDPRTFNEAFEEARRVTGQVTYERVKPAEDWFVVTGWRGDLGRYEKTYVWREGGELHNASLIITFEREAQPAYADAIRVLSHSFRHVAPSSDAVAARGPRIASPSAEPSSNTGRSPSVSREETALPEKAAAPDNTAPPNAVTGTADSPYREDCLQYGPPSSVVLRGRITRQVVPGKPNYRDIAAGDEKQSLELLLTDLPVCTLDGSFDDEVAEVNQRQIQLVSDDLEDVPTGQEVMLKGYLFHAVAEGQYRPLLLFVTDTVSLGAEMGDVDDPVRPLLLAASLVLIVALAVSIRWWLHHPEPISSENDA